MKKLIYAAKLSFIALLFTGVQVIKAQCTVNFTYTLGANGVVNFSGLASPSNSTTSYYWYFYGSSNVVGPNSNIASTTYTANGTYSVTFGIWSSAPTCSVNTTQTISVTNVNSTTTTPCSANYTCVTGPNGSVNFISTSTGTTPGTTFNWNVWSAPTGTMSGANPSYTFNTNGYKLVCLSINTNTTPGCTSSKCDSVMITNTSSQPTCSANFSQVTGPNGSVNFVSTSTGTTASSAYFWNFGGSATGSGIAPSHTYSSNGAYLACLTMVSNTTAPNSCSSSVCYSVIVSNVTSTTPCNANFSYVTGPNGSVSFASTSTGTTTGTSYSWSFGGSATASGPTSNYVYTSNGVKVVCLTITTNSIGGCSSTKCDTVTISNVTSSTTPCNADFVSVLGSNGSVSFVSTSTGTVAGTLYNWSFGDATNGTGIAPTHTYSTNGYKTVCLTITNSVSAWCTSTKCYTILISNTGGSVTPCAPSVVYTLTKDTTQAFTWYAYPFYPSNITNATWSWGDGTTTTGLFPSHTYSAAGTYSTCVTVSVSCGTVTASYCYVAGIYRSSENNDMILVNIRQSVPTGIRNQAKADDQISIYPNPNNGEFFLELTSSGKELKEKSVIIYNIMGEKVFEKQVQVNTKQNIDVSALANGTYLVKVSSEAGSYHRKIVIQK